VNGTEMKDRLVSVGPILLIENENDGRVTSVNVYALRQKRSLD